MPQPDRVSQSIALIGVIAITAAMSFSITRNYYQKKAVEIGYAEYNSSTGVWQWKDRK